MGAAALTLLVNAPADAPTQTRYSWERPCPSSSHGGLAHGPILAGLGRAVVVASLVATGATLATMGWFTLTDQQVLIVTSGSMAPVFNAGDAVIVHRPTAANLVAGTIISFHAPASMNRLTTHRIMVVYSWADGVFLQTKGDHNKVPDPDLTPVGNVTGVMAGAVPFVGRWLAFYSSANGKLTVLGLPLLHPGPGRLCCRPTPPPPDRTRLSHQTRISALTLQSQGHTESAFAPGQDCSRKRNAIRRRRAAGCLSPGGARIGVVYGTERSIDRLRKPIVWRASPGDQECSTTPL
jgi:signal peptidase